MVICCQSRPDPQRHRGAVEGALLDGMVCLASCDKTVPGQLMAAARLNIPTMVVACGYQPSGRLSRRAHRHRGGVPQRGPCGQRPPDVEELSEMSDDAILARRVLGHGHRQLDARR